MKTIRFRDYFATAIKWKISFQNQLPDLPDDLMILIFNEFGGDRAQLSTSCKRFRELDFEIGGKTFECIDVKWVSPFFRVFQQYK